SGWNSTRDRERRWIGLPLLYPEERPFAITKSPQIRMTVFALIRQEELDMKRLQSRLIEGQRTLDIADGQNHVVKHCSLLPAQSFMVRTIRKRASPAIMRAYASAACSSRRV